MSLFLLNALSLYMRLAMICGYCEFGVNMIGSMLSIIIMIQLLRLGHMNSSTNLATRKHLAIARLVNAAITVFFATNSIIELKLLATAPVSDWVNEESIGAFIIGAVWITFMSVRLTCITIQLGYLIALFTPVSKPAAVVNNQKNSRDVFAPPRSE